MPPGRIQKKLSICLTGRNDNYGGNFNQRMSLSINYLADNAKKTDTYDNLEIVVTDWNSESPLAEALDLTPRGARICRFIVVPPAIAEKINHPGTGFHSTRALNVALRRAAGEFLLHMPADSLITGLCLFRLIALLKGEIQSYFDIKKTGMIINRKHLPIQFDLAGTTSSFHLIDKYLALNESTLDRGGDLTGLISGAGAIVIHHEICRMVHGFDETLGGYGANDIDFGLRVNMNYPVINLSNFGLTIYDFHPSSELRPITNQRLNPYRYFNFTKRDEGWGLKESPLKSTEKKESVNTGRGQDHSEKRKEVHLPVEELTGKAIKQYLTGNLHYKVPEIFPYYFPLTWAALNKKCFKYLEYGTIAGFASLIVSAANPCSEIYYVPAVSPSVLNANDSSLIIKIATLLSEKGHRGIVRFVPGNPADSLQRLKKSFTGNMYFDLVLMQTDSFGKEAVKHIREIVRYIPKGGNLLVTGNDMNSFHMLRSFMQQEHPGYTTLVCEKYQVCLFMNRTVNFDRLTQSQLEKAWHPFKRNKIPLYFAYLSHILRKLFFQLVFVEYWMWPSRILKFVTEIRRNSEDITKI